MKLILDKRLAITELILDNFLGDFEPEEIVALLSCFSSMREKLTTRKIPVDPKT